MNVSFLHDDPLDSVIVDSADGRPLYEVKTPSKNSGSITTIRRPVEHGSPPGEGQIVAQIHWHSWSSSKITFMGNEMLMDEFLRKLDGFLSRCKVLTGSDGREYKWKYSKTLLELTLFDHQADAMVAQSHRKKLGIFSEPQKKMNIDIFEQGIPGIDIIVVSFIITEKKQRESYS